ncbi:hypothetical protein Tco_0052484 [Tanacetum coccineum]
MSFITAQQTKLDLELVPKEKILVIRKCNGRLNPGKIQREPTFQDVLDALALTPCYSAFLITADVLEVYMHQFWDSVYKHDTFFRFKMDKRKRFKLNMEIFRDIFKICLRVQGLDFDALPTDEGIASFLRDIGYTKEINSLNDVIITGLDKLRLSKAQILRFKKPASPQLSTVLVSSEEPTKKSKRVKRSAKKSTKAPTRGVVIRETPEMPLSKKKEKVDVARGNDKDDINKEQDSSGEDSDQENDINDDKTQSDNENESDSEHETDENESGSESDQDENEEDIGDDEEEVKDKLVKTPSNDSDDEDETKITDKVEGDEDEEMNYTTSYLYDDVDIRLNEPVDIDKEFVQEEGIDAAMTNVQQGNENPEILQVIEDAYVTLSTVPLED